MVQYKVFRTTWALLLLLNIVYNFLGHRSTRYSSKSSSEQLAAIPPESNYKSVSLY